MANELLARIAAKYSKEQALAEVATADLPWYISTTEQGEGFNGFKEAHKSKLEELISKLRKYLPATEEPSIRDAAISIARSTVQVYKTAHQKGLDDAVIGTFLECTASCTEPEVFMLSYACKHYAEAAANLASKAADPVTSMRTLRDIVKLADPRIPQIANSYADALSGGFSILEPQLIQVFLEFVKGVMQKNPNIPSSFISNTAEGLNKLGCGAEAASSLLNQYKDSITPLITVAPEYCLEFLDLVSPRVMASGLSSAASYINLLERYKNAIMGINDQTYHFASWLLGITYGEAFEPRETDEIEKNISLVERMSQYVKGQTQLPTNYAKTTLNLKFSSLLARTHKSMSLGVICHDLTSEPTSNYPLN